MPILEDGTLYRVGTRLYSDPTIRPMEYTAAGTYIYAPIYPTYQTSTPTAPTYPTPTAPTYPTYSDRTGTRTTNGYVAPSGGGGTGYVAPSSGGGYIAPDRTGDRAGGYVPPSNGGGTGGGFGGFNPFGGGNPFAGIGEKLGAVGSYLPYIAIGAVALIAIYYFGKSREKKKRPSSD